MSALKSLGPRPPGAFPPSRRSLNLLRERLVGAMSREWLGKFLFSELNNRQISMPKVCFFFVERCQLPHFFPVIDRYRYRMQPSSHKPRERWSENVPI